MLEQTLLGFDFGTKRIGIAIGQTLTKTARPLTQLNTNDWLGLGKLIDEWRPHAFVVGLPLNMDDSTSPISKLAKQFAKQLEQRFNRTVYLCDERLSSRAALEHLQERGITKPSKQEINSTAAAVVLQSWLCSLSNGI
jgi:putative holliday junction resolvase